MSPEPSSSNASFQNPSDLLGSFQSTRILSSDQRIGFAYILGTALPSGSTERQPTILKVEKTAYDLSELSSISSASTWDKLEMKVANDIYSTVLAWYGSSPRGADVQFSSICPATDKHIKKYSVQTQKMVRETPELYKTVVEPYINALPAGQINWVYNILDGTSEAENVVLRVKDPVEGFVLTPDLKWDQKTLSSMYLLVLVETRKIRSLRDLKRQHLPLLKSIRRKVEDAIVERYDGVTSGEMRMFIHYQPTYYHFHIHVTHLSYVGFGGITVGQAHLLEDVIDNLELHDNYYSGRTLTYGLGIEHPLFERLSGGSVP